MKIIIKRDPVLIYSSTVTGPVDVELQDVFSGVTIPTDQGLFGIAQRDGGLEIMLDGKLVWNSHGNAVTVDLVPGRKYLYKGKVWEFSRIGGTGFAIIHPPGEPDMQSSMAVDAAGLKPMAFSAASATRPGDLHPKVEQALDAIDAAVFSSDQFHNPGNAAWFQVYLDRWQKAVR